MVVFVLAARYGSIKRFEGYRVWSLKTRVGLVLESLFG